MKNKEKIQNQIDSYEKMIVTHEITIRNINNGTSSFPKDTWQKAKTEANKMITEYNEKIKELMSFL